MGLFLAQRAVEQLGGTITVQSVVGEGSEFVLRLPAKPEEIAPAEAPPPGAAKLVASQEKPHLARRVLVVDDVVDAAASPADLLQIWGCEVKVANDGPQALQILAEFSPDIILLDIGMPYMDGYEVARHIRDRALSPGATLVAMTGFGQSEDSETTRMAGFDKHLVKPVELAALEALVNGR